MPVHMHVGEFHTDQGIDDLALARNPLHVLIILVLAFEISLIRQLQYMQDFCAL